MRGGLALALLLLVSPGNAEAPAPERAVAEQIFTHINAYRVKRGLQPLQNSGRLTEAAEFHSAGMFQSGQVAHEIQNGMCLNLMRRVRRSQVFCLTFGENLFRADNHAAKEVAESAVESWVQSPRHLKNLVNPAYTRTGIGVVGQSNGSFYCTQIFAMEPLELSDLKITPEGPGYHIRFHGKVLSGAQRGAVFFQSKRRLRWEADEHQEFDCELTVEKAGLIEIGQEMSSREWSVETEFRVGDDDDPHHK